MFDQQLLRGEIDPKVYSSFSENLLLGPSREHEDVSFCSGSRPSHFSFELYHYEHHDNTSKCIVSLGGLAPTLALVYEHTFPWDLSQT